LYFFFVAAKIGYRVSDDVREVNMFAESCIDIGAIEAFGSI
jgi:hypothetical protein